MTWCHIYVIAITPWKWNHSHCTCGRSRVRCRLCTIFGSAMRSRSTVVGGSCHTRRRWIWILDGQSFCHISLDLLFYQSIQCSWCYLLTALGCGWYFARQRSLICWRCHCAPNVTRDRLCKLAAAGIQISYSRYSCV